jgi:HK97 family phage major capsid protein
MKGCVLTMATTFSETNGWIPEPIQGPVLQKVLSTSALEQAARKVQMSTRTVRVPRHDAAGVDVVAALGTIPLLDATLDEVTLTALKFANRHAISLENSRDAITNEIDTFKLRWASNFAVKLDNACLGATGGSFGVGNSVYEKAIAAASTNHQNTAGHLTLAQLAKAVGELEAGDYPDDLVVVAHPAFAMQLRQMTDSYGFRVLQDPLQAGVPTLYGHPVYFSRGAVASTGASDRPTGNPLLVVGSQRNLILGVRDGVESAISDQAAWDTDGIELKMRARRGFAVADGNAFRVIELTAS